MLCTFCVKPCVVLVALGSEGLHGCATMGLYNGPTLSESVLRPSFFLWVPQHSLLLGFGSVCTVLYVAKGMDLCGREWLV